MLCLIWYNSTQWKFPHNANKYSMQVWKCTDRGIINWGTMYDYANCVQCSKHSVNQPQKKKPTKNTPNLKLSLPFRITLLRTSLSLLVHFLFKVTSSCTCGSALDLLWYVRTSSSLSCTTVQSDSNECSPSDIESLRLRDKFTLQGTANGGRITPDHAYSRSTLDTVDCDWNMLKTVQFFSSIQFYLYITKSQQQLPQGAAEIQHSPPTFTVQVTLKRN